MGPKFAIYILVVEDTNKNAEELGSYGASNVESVMEIESEEEAIRIAAILAREGEAERG